MESSSIEITRLDHHGLVSSVIDEMNLVEIINSRVKNHGNREVSIGHCVKAMIINGLGFTTRVLYLTPNFFKDKPIDLLVGPGITAESLNKDSLSSALDALYEYGVSRLFMIISFYVHKLYNIPMIAKHLDSTTLSMQGRGTGEDCDVSVRVIPGYNKEGQHNLSQIVLNLISNNIGGLPIFLKIMNGNTQDKNGFKETIEEYQSELKKEEEIDDSLFVADSSLYTAENIKDLSNGLRWLTRAPHALTWVKALYESSENEEWQVIGGEPNYSYQIGKTQYGGVWQGYLLMLSQKKQFSDLKKIEEEINKENQLINQKIAKLTKKEYATEELAKAKITDLNKSQKYHELENVKLVAHPKYGKGRRNENSVPKSYYYKIESSALSLKDEVITKAKNKAGKFVLVTNDIHPNVSGSKGKKLFKQPVEKLLDLYKNGQQHVERGFRFIKGGEFRLSKFFVRMPGRIVAISMIICLALLVYLIAQWKLRKGLQDANETLPNQIGKQVKNPTMNWIFQIFQGISVLTIKGEKDLEGKIIGRTDLHKKVIEMMNFSNSTAYGC